MANQYRFGDYRRISRGGQKVISINDLKEGRPLEKDAEGNVIPHEAPRIRLTTQEVFRQTA